MRECQRVHNNDESNVCYRLHMTDFIVNRSGTPMQATSRVKLQWLAMQQHKSVGGHSELRRRALPHAST